MPDDTADTDTVMAADHEDPDALTDYHATHMAEAAKARIRDTLADSLARGLFGNLTTEDGLPICEQTIATWGRDYMRDCAEFALADERLQITLADAT